MLAATAGRGERAKAGANQFKRSSHDTTTSPTLAEIGISRDQSSRWQQLASMSEEHFEATVETAKNTAGEVTTAFMLREAKKFRGAPKKTNGSPLLRSLGVATGAQEAEPARKATPL